MKTMRPRQKRRAVGEGAVPRCFSCQSLVDVMARDVLRRGVGALRLARDREAQHARAEVARLSGLDVCRVLDLWRIVTSVTHLEHILLELEKHRPDWLLARLPLVEPRRATSETLARFAPLAA